MMGLFAFTFVCISFAQQLAEKPRVTATVDRCKKYQVEGVPDAPDAGKCAFSRLSTKGEEIYLKLPDGKIYSASLTTSLDADGIAVAFLLQKPNAKYVYKMVVPTGFHVTIEFGEVVIQQTEESWFLRYSPDWIEIRKAPTQSG